MAGEQKTERDSGVCHAACPSAAAEKLFGILGMLGGPCTNDVSREAQMFAQRL